MREILFRGKRRDNGEWVVGSLVKMGPTGYVHYFILPDYASAFYDIEVEQSTIGQYTGLTDKNGVKIFEGDICLCEMMNDDRKIYDAGVCVVEWYKENTMFTLMSPDEEFEFSFLSGYEVIGNIHDNPELLEAEL